MDYSFESMVESERARVVMSILFAATSREGNFKEIMLQLKQSEFRCKKLKSGTDSGDQVGVEAVEVSGEETTQKITRVSFVYELQGKRLCRYAFVAIMQMNVRNLSRLATEVISTDGLVLLDYQRINTGGEGWYKKTSTERFIARILSQV